MKVSHKASLILGINILGVLLVGGMSIYFARSIYVAAEEIRREQREIEVANRIHIAFHHFLLALHRAAILSRPIPESARSGYQEQMRQLLAYEHSYHQESPEQRVVEDIRRVSSELLRLSSEIGSKGPDASPEMDRRHLDELQELASSTQLSAHSLSIAHQVRMDKLLEQNKSSMQSLFNFYVVMLLLGTALVVGSGFYFSHAMARPLRWLSQAAEDIARGGVREKVPVTSNDEIGLLSRTFNVMVERLDENEAGLRRLTILEERERIAAELHDSVAQSLAFLNLKLRELESNLRNEGRAATGTTIQEMREIIGDAYDDVRQAIFGLRTAISGKVGFVPGLTEFIRDYSLTRKVAIDLRIPDPEGIHFAPHAEVQLTRIIQEALANVSKHAEAKTSVVSIERDGDCARIIIEDDGKGFVLDEMNGSAFHFGLKTMRERAQAVGGRFAVESATGKGTKIIVRMPLERNDHHDAGSSASGR